MKNNNNSNYSPFVDKSQRFIQLDLEYQIWKLKTIQSTIQKFGPNISLDTNDLPHFPNLEMDHLNHSKKVDK